MAERINEINDVKLPDGYSEPGPLPYQYYPGVVKRVKGFEPELREVTKGLYVVDNANVGLWEFFPGRPICFIAADGNAYYPKVNIPRISTKKS